MNKHFSALLKKSIPVASSTMLALLKGQGSQTVARHKSPVKLQGVHAGEEGRRVGTRTGQGSRGD